MRSLAPFLLALGSIVVATNVASSDPSRYFAFGKPTDRYRHGVLSDTIEFGSLQLRKAFLAEMLSKRHSDGSFPDPGDFDSFLILAEHILPDNRVFEDIQPRTVDLNGDGRDEIVIVETQQERGAQLAVYQLMEINGTRWFHKLAATPHIGQPYRWLAPAGIADFDGDGRNDIAYIETPHLGKILKIVTLRGTDLVPIVEAAPGFSNHKIGQDFITSGVRACSGRIELLTPNADWTALMAVRVEAGEIVAEATAFEPSLAGIAQAQRCE